MELILGYAAGLLTLINPCVLPVLPIVLATALQSGRHGPALLALGLSVSFIALGVSVAAFGHAVGITEETIANAGAVLMIGFGLVLLVPRFSEGFALATAGPLGPRRRATRWGRPHRIGGSIPWAGCSSARYEPLHWPRRSAARFRWPAKGSRWAGPRRS